VGGNWQNDHWLADGKRLSVSASFDTGEFFIPSSAMLLVATLGTTVPGWRTPVRYRMCLAVPLAMIFGVLILTTIEFWPRNAALWAVARNAPTAVHDREAIILMVRQWVVMDWVRMAMGTAGFIASVRAISIPYVEVEHAKPASLTMKLAYGVGIAAVLAFVAYFVSKV
jgi:Domain of unknown function (DUF1772)